MAQTAPWTWLLSTTEKVVKKVPKTAAVMTKMRPQLDFPSRSTSAAKRRK